MRSPAAAIAWEFRHRHRWGLMAVVGYFLILAAIRIVFLAPGQRVDLDVQSFALLVVVPITSTFVYFLAVFSYGLDGDLAARQSMYPARMFTRPATAGALAGWPMLYGAVAMALLWMGTRLLGIWPSDSKYEVPMVWPALLAASLLAWTQALTWMPYPLRGLRVTITVLWLAAIDAIVMIALELKASEPVMLAILAPHVPLAYFTARFAVGRARRGDVPDWRGVFAPFGSITNVLPRQRARFRSPAAALAWLEWRRYGRSLPAMVAIVIPFELALLFLFRSTPVIIFETLMCVLLTPPFMAAFVAATVSESNSHGRDSYGLTPFLATRPVTSASLIAAKLKAAMWSTLAAWALVLVATPIALMLSGTSSVVSDWVRQLIEIAGRPRAITMLLLLLAMFVASTWKQLVQSLYIGLTGREWAVKASVFVALFFIAIMLPLGHWTVTNRRVLAVVLTSFPWIAALLVCVKLSASAWIVARLYDTRLLSDRALILGAVCWTSAVLVLYGLLAWLLPALLFRRYSLALVAILTIPLARLSAAPLALVWNRHR